MNKFQIGLSPYINLKEYMKIYNKYKKNIDSIYFSINFDNEIYSRKKMKNFFLNKKNEKKYIKILKYFNKKKIKLELVINSGQEINKEIIKNIKKKLKKYNIYIDSIVFLEKDYDIIKKNFNNKKLIFSYNNNIRKIDKEKLNKYDNIILGNSLIRNLKNKLLIKCIYLINNGCSFNCNWCVNNIKNDCYEIFKNNLKNNDVNLLYSFQSILPFELNTYNKNNIKNFKISSRTMNYNELNKILFFYINKKKISNKNDLFLFCSLSHFYKFKNDLNIKEINKIKKGIKWDIY